MYVQLVVVTSMSRDIVGRDQEELWRVCAGYIMS